MKESDHFDSHEKLFAAYIDATDPSEVKEMSPRQSRILDAKYEPADLDKIIAENCTDLTDEQKDILLQTLKSFEKIFDGSLGTWDCPEIKWSLCTYNFWYGTFLENYFIPNYRRNTKKLEAHDDNDKLAILVR